VYQLLKDRTEAGKAVFEDEDFYEIIHSRESLPNCGKFALKYS